MVRVVYLSSWISLDHGRSLENVSTIDFQWTPLRYISVPLYSIGLNICQGRALDIIENGHRYWRSHTVFTELSCSSGRSKCAYGQTEISTTSRSLRLMSKQVSRALSKWVIINGCGWIYERLWMNFFESMRFCVIWCLGSLQWSSPLNNRRGITLAVTVAPRLLITNGKSFNHR